MVRLSEALVAGAKKKQNKQFNNQENDILIQYFSIPKLRHKII
jgi:hypothetical protein